METPEQIKTDIIQSLKRILEISLPHCDDGNLNEQEFILINKLAHSCLKRVDKSHVEEFI